MSAFNKFDSFITKLAAGVFADAVNADTDVLRVYLTNVTPDAAAMAEKADLAEIAAGNGYLSGGIDAQNAASQVGGVISVVGTNIVFTAAGGQIGPFQHAVLYDDSVAGDPLIGWWGYGAPVTLQDGETLTVDFGASLFTAQ